MSSTEKKNLRNQLNANPAATRTLFRKLCCHQGLVYIIWISWGHRTASKCFFQILWQPFLSRKAYKIQILSIITSIPNLRRFVVAKMAPAWISKTYPLWFFLTPPKVLLLFPNSLATHYFTKDLENTNFKHHHLHSEPEEVCSCKNGSCMNL